MGFDLAFPAFALPVFALAFPVFAFTASFFPDSFKVPQVLISNKFNHQRLGVEAASLFVASDNSFPDVLILPAQKMVEL